MKKTILAFSLVLSLGFSAGASAGDNETSGSVLPAYEKVRGALAADNLNAARQAAATLAEKATADKNEAISKGAADLAQSSDLEKAREQFKAVSQAVIPLVKGKAGYYVIRCDMARAAWVQTDKNVQNPYLGKAMLSCGVVEASSPSKENPHSQAGPCCR